MAKSKSVSRSAQLKKIAQKKKRQEKIKNKLKQKKITPKMGYRTLKKATNRMAELIFEPAILQIPVDKSELQKVHHSDFSLPRKVSEFFNPDLIGAFVLAVRGLLNYSKNSMVILNANTFLRMYDHGLPPIAVLGVFIAFYKQRVFNLLQEGEEITPENILAVVADYEKTYEAELTPLVDEYLKQSSETAEFPMMEDEKEEPQEVEETLITQFSSPSGSTKMNDEMRSLVEKILKSPLEKAVDKVELEDDLEVFCFDFLMEEGVYAPHQIEAGHFQEFFDHWFQSHLSPTEEDKLKMKKNLALLQDFLVKENIFDVLKKQQVDKVLAR